MFTIAAAVRLRNPSWGREFGRTLGAFSDSVQDNAWAARLLCRATLGMVNGRSHSITNLQERAFDHG